MEAAPSDSRRAEGRSRFTFLQKPVAAAGFIALADVLCAPTSCGTNRIAAMIALAERQRHWRGWTLLGALRLSAAGPRRRGCGFLPPMADGVPATTPLRISL
jgi:hypothetical protein